MSKETLLGKKMKEDYGLKKCCNLCGFPVDIPRKPVIITNNILSLLEYDESVCLSCGHVADGSTIPVVYDHLQKLMNKFVKERDDLMKFLSYYHNLTAEQRKQVCVEIPRFMRKSYKSTGKMEDDDLEEPYSWNVVHIEVINNTQLGRVMVRDIDWQKVEGFK